MNSPNNTKKWKDALLRSSLPLEHLVAQKLSKLGIYVSGEYTYLCPNENGINTEFSTDLWAFDFLEEHLGEENFWSSYNFVIECKYTHKSVKWLFSPHPQIDDESLDMGYINIFQDLCVKQVDADILYDFDKDLKYCIKGIELLEKDCNPNTIKKGLNQLKYAAAQLSKNIMVEQVCEFNDEDLKIGFLCPILVTTAPLYVIRENLELDNFYDAQEIENIGDRVKFLVVHQSNGIQLEKYVEDISSEFCNRYKELDERLREIDFILNRSNYEGSHMPDSFFLKDKLGRASEQILIVSYDYFEECFNSILDIIKQTGTSLKKYAKLEYDALEKKSTIRSI